MGPGEIIDRENECKVEMVESNKGYKYKTQTYENDEIISIRKNGVWTTKLKNEPNELNEPNESNDCQPIPDYNTYVDPDLDEYGCIKDDPDDDIIKDENYDIDNPYSGILKKPSPKKRWDNPKSHENFENGFHDQKD